MCRARQHIAVQFVFIALTTDYRLSSGLAVHARLIELGFGRGRRCYIKLPPPPPKRCLVNISLRGRAAVQRTGGCRAKQDRGSGPRFLIRDGSVVLTVGGTNTSVREAELGGR